MINDLFNEFSIIFNNSLPVNLMRSEDVISKIELICNLPLTEDALVHFGDLMFPFRVRESVSARRKHFAAYVTPPTTVGQFNQISVLVCKEKTDKCVRKDRQMCMKRRESACDNVY